MKNFTCPFFPPLLGVVEKSMTSVKEERKECLDFNKDKCRVLHVRRINLRHRYGLGVDVLGSSSGQKDQGEDLLDTMLPMKQQCALVHSGILGCIRKGIASRLREGLLQRSF